jgi:hypothetical protein
MKIIFQSYYNTILDNGKRNKISKLLALHGSKPRNSSDMAKSAWLNTTIMNFAIGNFTRQAGEQNWVFSRPNLIFTHQGDRASANFKDSKKTLMMKPIC